MKEINLLIRFLLEICGLLIVGCFGYSLGNNFLVKIIFALVLLLILSVIWAVFMAPKAVRLLSKPYHFIVEAIIFSTLTLMLYSFGINGAWLVFLVVYAFNKFLLMLWKQ